jgi:two-component system nitrate/nitrite response regulator NarL
MIPPQIRVLVVDDHEVMRLGVKYALNLQTRVVFAGEASNSEEALQQVEEIMPDVVLLDISLKRSTDGFFVARAIKERFKDVKVLIFSHHDEREFATKFIDSGADGFILKESTPKQLITAIEEVFEEKSPLSPVISKFVIEARRSVKDEEPPIKLSARETEVLILLASGLSTKLIADKLEISMRTVGVYRENIRTKLNLHTTADLTRYAIAKGLLPPLGAPSS